MVRTAHVLRDEYVETFDGSSFASGADGETVDVKQLLEDGGGVIVTDDVQLRAHLDGSHAFKRTGVTEAAEQADAQALAQPGGGPPVSVERVEPGDHTRDDLAELAEDEFGGDVVVDADGRALDLAEGGATKAEIADAVNARRERGDG